MWLSKLIEWNGKIGMGGRAYGRGNAQMTKDVSAKVQRRDVIEQPKICQIHTQVLKFKPHIAISKLAHCSNKNQKLSAKKLTIQQPLTKQPISPTEF